MVALRRGIADVPPFAEAALCEWLTEVGLGVGAVDKGRLACRQAGPGRRSPPRRSRFGPRDRHDFWVFLAFALPNILLIVAFSYRPVLSNIYYSTLNWTLGAANASAVGFGNYIQFFTSPDTLDIFRVTVVFTIATVGGSMLIGLAIALALNRKVRGSGIARAAVFSPTCSPASVSASSGCSCSTP